MALEDLALEDLTLEDLTLEDLTLEDLALEDLALADLAIAPRRAGVEEDWRCEGLEARFQAGFANERAARPGARQAAEEGRAWQDRRC
ncbi:hypothetical protein XH93_03960 [Bradyrhizobium sp. CCBAU 51753]|nr:hypothetical protein XH93_03960 [Bradyrhizobium sp. CCBAU 51753]